MKSISKIISTVLLMFSILLLCYIFYRSQIFHEGTKFNYYLKYYIISFLFLGLSLASFFISEKLKKDIATICLSTLIGLYFVEGYLLIKDDDDRYVIYKNSTGKDYDKRTKLEIYQDLKKEDPNIVVTIRPRNLLDDNNLNYFTLSGISNRKTINCNENGYYSIFQSDRYGFNNPDEEWDKNVVDFFLVGGSFVYGYCVNESDTISGNLRKLIDNKKGVINVGGGNNGSLTEYATLREYLPIKKVERVLWIYIEGDLAQLGRELKNQILVNYLQDKSFSQNVILRKQEIQKLLLKKLNQVGDGLDSITFRFIKLYSTREVIFNKIKHYFSTPAPVPTEEFKNILKLSNKLTKENNSKLYFVYLPLYNRYAVEKQKYDLQLYKEVIEIVESLNIPIIDLHEELFKKYDDPLSLFPFRKKGHYTEKGYQLVAETIFNKINEFEK